MRRGPVSTADGVASLEKDLSHVVAVESVAAWGDNAA